MSALSWVLAREAGEQARAAGRARSAWDPWIAGSAGALILLGLVMVYSASIALADRTAGHSTYYLWRHLAHLAVGVVAMLAVMNSRIRWWEKAGPYLLLLGIALLAVVIIPGIGATVNGSSRWLRLGLFNVQPSEFVKLFMLVYAAGYLVRNQDELRSFSKGILMVSVVLAVIGALLLQEPDLGSAVVLTLTIFLMLFLGGVRVSHFVLTLGGAVAAMVALTLISPYRLARVTGFLDPWADPFNSGFQLVQALIAFGRGEWFGVGLGASIQKVFYLPAAHTDFILAIIAEELGLLGVLVVMALFAVLVARAFAISRRAEAKGQVYAARLAQGLGLLVGIQALVNMGVNMGVLPTKGLTLPLVSYGGSSTVVTCMIVGLLLRIERETRERVAA